MRSIACKGNIILRPLWHVGMHSRAAASLALPRDGVEAEPGERASGAERCAGNLARAPEFGVEMIRRRGAKPRRHLDLLSGAGRKQHAPPMHLDRGERLLTKPFEARRPSAEQGRECKGPLVLLHDRGQKPLARAAVCRDGVEAGGGRPERFGDLE